MLARRAADSLRSSVVAELEQDKADIGQGVRKLDSLLLMRKWGPAVIEPDDV